MKWHRIFGLALTDFFTDTAYRVELEKDLSLKQQFLDVVIIEQESGSPRRVKPEFGDTVDPSSNIQQGNLLAEVPDGLDNLAKHNLLTYKSLRQTMDGWALDELVGHYVNYRKQISPSLKKLLPVDEFRLYAVSTRFPRKLAEHASFETIQDGVFEVLWGGRVIRIIVLSRIPPEERNALWELFSAIPEKVRLGASQYRPRQTDGSTMFYQLYQQYQIEGLDMPYTWEDFQKDFKKEFLAGLTVDDRLRGLATEDRLKGLATEDRLKGLATEDRLKGLATEDRLKGLATEDRLKGLATEDRLKGLATKDRLKGLAAEELLKELFAEDRLKELSVEKVEAYLEKLRRRKN